MNGVASVAGRQAAVPFVLVCVFIDVLGFGLIIPVLPALIGSFTHDAAAQAHWYGWMTAGYGLMQFVFAPVLGALSDRYGRRVVLLGGIAGLGLDFLLAAFAPNLAWLMVARLVGGATASNFSVANAYVADVSPPETRAQALGKIGAAFGIGFIVGPVVGGLLSGIDLRAPFLAAAGLALINFAYGWFVLPESLPVERRTRFRWAKANPFSAIRGLFALHGIGPLVWVFALTMLAQFLLHSTWVLFTTFRFGWGPLANGVSLCVVGLSAAIVQGVLIGPIIRRWGEVKSAMVGMGSAAIAYVLYASATQGWMLYAIIAANALGFLVNPALQGLISKNVDPTEQGVTMGALSSVSSLLLVLGPLIGTPLLAAASHLPRTDWRLGGPLLVSAALQVTAALAAWIFVRRHPERTTAVVA